MMDGSTDAFAATREIFDRFVVFMGSDGAVGLQHGELEEQVDKLGREVIRQAVQDHLDVRAARERQLVIRGVDGVERRSVEAGRERQLATVFGRVTHRRLAYRQRGCGALHPADAALNLPVELHSHGVRRLAAVEAARGSFDDATRVICERTGSTIGKRQVEQLAVRAAQDFHSFYRTRRREPVLDGDVLVGSVDGKGIVMLADSLRELTRSKAASRKLKGRTSRGEKPNRKRMAEVGAVYEITPQPRTPRDVLARSCEQQAPPPRAKNKWLTASVVQDADEVIAEVFDDADRRDPERTRMLVILVDGNRHQIRCAQAQARERQRPITIIIDFIHVIEYLWTATWCFHNEGDPQAEDWVHDRALAILTGNAVAVAQGIRRFATRRNLTGPRRTTADKCANYLDNQSPYLDYPTALNAGWPIATGIIEGACRHLVKDRMDITGARWGLQGAEAVLHLRAIRSNGDFDEYWRYHQAQEHQRTHLSQYDDESLTLAA